MRGRGEQLVLAPPLIITRSRDRRPARPLRARAGRDRDVRRLAAVTRRPLPRSLYAETARPAIDTPPLDGDRRVDVCVIGGGFTGLSAALHLAEQGVEVAVLEAHEPGWGASGGNGGQVNPGLKHDPDQVEADFGADLGGRMVALSGDAPNAGVRLIERHQIDCDALQSGTLRAAFGMRDAGASGRRPSRACGAARRWNCWSAMRRGMSPARSAMSVRCWTGAAGR